MASVGTACIHVISSITRQLEMCSTDKITRVYAILPRYINQLSILMDSNAVNYTKFDLQFSY